MGTLEMPMRRLCIAPALFASCLFLALGPQLAVAQGDLPEPARPFQPPPPAPPPPIKPYKPVAVTPPAAFSDAAFQAFRKSLVEAVQRKDRAALAKLVVSKDFFWVRDTDLADDSKPGIDNLAKAVDLDNPNGDGWATLSDATANASAAELPQHPGIFCSPAPPQFAAEAFGMLLQDTDTDPTDWGYPARDGVEARAAPEPDAQVTEKLGMNFIRVLADSPPAAPGAPAFLHVALPSGKTGFVAAQAVMPLDHDLICYTKESGNWKIAGYVGGMGP
jgi:hypothetical protein